MPAEDENELIDETAKGPEDVRDPEQIALKWFKEAYQGDNVKQLTLRTVGIDGFLGGFMSLSNLYIGLKTGWGLGVARIFRRRSGAAARQGHTLLSQGRLRPGPLHPRPHPLQGGA